jgi:mRNA-degrading endonuclease YafQ of YafQ-DinJ toxin-antitoxin module
MFIARSKRFDKQHRKLPVKVQKQFGERLKLFLEDDTNPLLHTHALAGEYRGSSSFNVNADVRAIFIKKDSDTVYFSAIGSHSELYE